MTVPVRDAGNEVNRANTMLAGVIRGEYRIDPSSYRSLVGDYTNLPSDNHDLVGHAIDVANLTRGWPTVFPEDRILGFAHRTADDPRIGQREGSILSPVYHLHLSFNPLMGVYGCALKMRQTRPAWQEVAGKYRAMLRTMIVNAAKAGLLVTPKGITKEQEEGGIPFGPGVIRARSAPYDWSPRCAIAGCGRRGWDLNERASGYFWPWYVVQTSFGHAVDEYGLGLRPVVSPSSAADACKAAWGFDMALFTAAEQSTIERLMQGDPEALLWAFRVIGERTHEDRVREIRTTGGVTTVLLESGKGPTSAKVAHTVYADGAGDSMGVDSPHRGKGGAWNRAHTATVDMALRVVTGHAEASDNQPETTVRCDVAPGEVIWDFEWGGGRPLVEHHPVGLVAAVPEPEPVPSPDGPADAFDWLVNAGRRRAAVGPGFYGTISPVAGHPHLFMLRKGPGEIPWSTELLWRDEERGRIALVAECGFVDGVLGNFRIFFDETGRPGVTWLRRSIDRATGDSFRALGTVIEHAVTDGGDPYRGDGADLPAGSVRESKVDADSTVEHVGVTTALGERVAILRRSDLMGDRSRPSTREREVYEIGFGAGAFGYVKWDSYRDGVFDRGGAAERIESDGGPALCFGVDPLDPELRERWFATADFAGELPAPGAPTRRPSSRPAPGPTPTPKRGGCLLPVALFLGSAGAALAALL